MGLVKISLGSTNKKPYGVLMSKTTKQAPKYRQVELPSFYHLPKQNAKVFGGVEKMPHACECV